jgi:hypothetical protein
MSGSKMMGPLMAEGGFAPAWRSGSTRATMQPS